jgi:phage terminase small subunit
MNIRRQRFVEHLARGETAVQAAREAGYHDPQSSGQRLLHEPEVHAALKAKVEAVGVETADVLRRLVMHAFTDPSLLAACFIMEGGRRVLDWNRVYRVGLGPLIRRVTPTRHGDSVELVDSQKALELIGKHLGMFTERIRLEGDIDVSVLSDAQLQMLIKGEDPARVLAMVRPATALAAPNGAAPEPDAAG